MYGKDTDPYVYHLVTNEEKLAEEQAIARYVIEAIDKAIADPDVGVWEEGDLLYLRNRMIEAIREEVLVRRAQARRREKEKPSATVHEFPTTH